MGPNKVKNICMNDILTSKNKTRSLRMGENILKSYK